MIHVACPCGKEADVRDDLAGKKVRCPACKQLLTVPGEPPLLLDDPPPPPPTVEPPKPAPAPIVEPPPEPAVEKTVPWKTIAMAASGVAVLMMILAVVGFMREDKKVVQGDPRDRDDLVRLRQSLSERDREIQTLKEIALQGDDPAKYQAFTKQIDALREEREKATAAAAQADVKVRWLEERLRTLEAAPAPKVEAPTALAEPALPPPKTESLPDVVQKCLPAVVVIKTDLGSGAGFFVADDGTLLTNYHVIAGSKGITVDYLYEGARRNGDARVRAVDPDNDLALVHVSPAGRVHFLAVEKASPRVGESVVAIGSPGMGGGTVLGSSVSTGIVSSDVREIEGRRFLQTTAPINPGNSGGPLLSSDGRLFGVVTAKAVGKEGIGFAVPADLARAFLDRRDEAAFKVDGSLADWESKRGHAIRTSHSIDKAVPLALPPMRLHVEDERDRLLALTPGDNSLHVLSISERKVLKSVAVGSEPSDWAVLPGGRTVWVANFGSKNLVKVDTERGAVVETLPLSFQPIKITYAKSQIWMLAAGQPNLTLYSFNDKKEYVLIGVPPGPTTYDARRDRIILGVRQGLIEFDPGRLLTLCKEMIRTRGFPNEQAAIKQELDKTLKGYPVSTMSDLENREMLAHERAGKLFYDRTLFRLDKLDTQLGMLKPNPYSYSDNPQVRAFIDRFRHLDQILAVSPDGKWAANGTHVYDVERFTVSNELPLPSPSVGFTRDSKTVWLFDFVNKALIPFPVEATADKKDKSGSHVPTPPAPPGAPAANSPVDQAVERAIAFLRQPVLSVFPFERDLYDVAPLKLLAFVRAGLPTTDKDVRTLRDHLLSKIERGFVRGGVDSTYEAALVAMALQEVDRVKFQREIALCGQYLVDTQCENGSWTYRGRAPHVNLSFPFPTAAAPAPVATGRRPGDTRPEVTRRILLQQTQTSKHGGDASNAQYAALGLRACHDAGVVPPEDVARRASKLWRDRKIAVDQAIGGLKPSIHGWGYATDGPLRGHTPTMTTAGIGALAIYDHLLGMDPGKDEDVQTGLQWFSQARGGPAGRVDIEYYYYLYGVERIGALCGFERLGGRDWYADGSTALLREQRPDGSFGLRTQFSDHVTNTCFAILFLKRATRPL